MYYVYVSNIHKSNEAAKQQQHQYQQQYQHQMAYQLLEYGLKNVYGELKDTSFVYEKNQYGKPYLKGFPKIEFNISHCKNMVACVISQNGAVGIDVEKKRDYHENITKRVFTEEEAKWFQEKEIIDKDKKEAFFQIWTLKESYIKAKGKGLAMPLTQVSFDCDALNKNIECNCIPSNQKQYTFFQWCFQEENQWDNASTYLALCIEGKATPEDVALSYVTLI